jgi:ABC-type transport system involved in multi-copper enzyme maturation permease subunit
MSWTGSLTLLHRAIRADALSWKWHAVRFGSACFLLILLIQAHVMTLGRGTSGRMFFEYVAQLNYLLMTLIGIGFFPTTITEEKEDGTLPLLILSGMPPLTILLAKAVGRLWSILLIFLAQLPFSFLALMLGGLTVWQILAVWWALFAYLVGLSGLGVAWSVVSSQGYRAARGMLASVLLLNFGGMAAEALADWLVLQKMIPARGAVQSVAERLGQLNQQISPMHRIRILLQSDSGVSLFHAESFTYFTIGIVLFLVAMLLFRRMTEYAHEPITRPPGLARARADRKTRRPWGEPLAWKEFQFLMSGLPGFAVQCLGLAVLLTVGYFSQRGLEKLLRLHFHEMAFVGLWSLFVLELTYFASRTFAWEQRAGTLPTLLMLPRSLVGVIVAKLTGGLLGCTPPLLAIAVMSIMTGQSPIHFDGGAWDGIAILGSLLVLLHLTALFSLDYPWAAIPLALGTFVVVGGLVFPFAAITSFVFAQKGPEEFASVIVTYLCALATIVMEIAIVIRIRALAAT